LRQAGRYLKEQNVVNYLDRRRGARGLNARPSLPDPQNAVKWLCRASATLTRATPDDSGLYNEMQTALAELCGLRVMTILRAAPGGASLQRVHSSHSEPLPSQSVKPLAGDPWLQHLMATTEPELSPNADTVKRHFFDAQAIFDLGCESVLNVPVRFRGRNLGILTLMHKADWYGPAHVAICQPFAALLGAAWTSDPAHGRG
jgi:GAF domain-containing protein